MRPRDVHYAWNGDTALAYEVFGGGPVDLVYLQGYTSHIDLNWHSPHLARFLGGLGDLGRVIHTDRRGWGCSDRFSPGDVAPLEVQVDDLLAVMDAAGSERAIVITSQDTAPTGVLFAAGRPDRAAGLVLIDALVWFYDSEPSRANWAEVNALVRRHWGTPAWDHFGSTWDEREFQEWFVPWCRAAVAPGALSAESDAFGAVDVRTVLPTVHVPTLVAVRADSDEESRVPGQQIPTARLLVQDFDAKAGAPFHWYSQRCAPLLSAIGELITDIREEESLDRVLATVLFTDIVDSTQTAARLGDHQWADLLERHHGIVRSLLARHRGHEVDTAGDGFFATFDGPARAVACASALVEAVTPLGITIRAGVHTGEIETIDGKPGGLAVVIGSRIASAARPSQVLASQTVKDLTAGSGLVFTDAGEHSLKGVPDRWHLYQAEAPPARR